MPVGLSVRDSMNRRSLRFRRLLVPGFWGYALLLIICSAALLAWKTAGTETGASILRLQWRDLTIGWFLGRYETVGSREPVEQAEFWLREADRVLAAHPDDAAVAMGAAIMLDSPGTGFLLKYYFEDWLDLGEGLPGYPLIPLWDDAGIEKAKVAFERRCKDRCLELAATATTLDPGNIEWPRCYAELLGSSSDTPRIRNWSEALDRCARRDPDNALYDYLATRFYWQAGADIVYPEHPTEPIEAETAANANLDTADRTGDAEDTLDDSPKADQSDEPSNEEETDSLDWEGRHVITDKAAFERGVARFRQGLTKPEFVACKDGLTAVMAFLARSRVPPAEYAGILRSCDMPIKTVLLLRDVTERQILRANEAAQTGNSVTALRLCRENMQAVAQYKRVHPDDYLLPASVRVRSVARMDEIVRMHPDAFSQAERQEIRSDLAGALLEVEVIRHAMKTVEDNRSGKEPAATGLGYSWLADVLATLVVLLLVVGLLMMALARFFPHDAASAVGPIGQVSAFVVAAGVSAVLFALAPAGYIDRNVQAWFWTGCLILAPLSGISWHAGRRLQKGLSRIGLRGVFGTAAVFLVAVTAVLWISVAFFQYLPLPLAVPELTGDDPGIRLWAAEWRDCRAIQAVVQWYLYHGTYLILVIWAVILLGVSGRKMRRVARSGGARFASRWRCAGSVLGCLEQPAIRLAVVLLIAYLWIMPSVLEKTEAKYQNETASLLGRDRWTAQVDEAIETVRSDSNLMMRLRRRVLDEMSDVGGRNES